MEDPLASLPITLVLIVTLTEPYTERKELVKLEQVFFCTELSVKQRIGNNSKCTNDLILSNYTLINTIFI